MCTLVGAATRCYEKSTFDGEPSFTTLRETSSSSMSLEWCSRYCEGYGYARFMVHRRNRCACLGALDALAHSNSTVGLHSFPKGGWNAGVGKLNIRSDAARFGGVECHGNDLREKEAELHADCCGA